MAQNLNSQLERLAWISQEVGSKIEKYYGRMLLLFVRFI